MEHGPGPGHRRRRKGKLSASVAGLQEAGWTEQAIVALAKENEELFVPDSPAPIVLPRDSQALFLVQRVRDEAHRFAVSFHRQKRNKTTFRSRLDEIPGVGPKRKQALLRHFGSLKGSRRRPLKNCWPCQALAAALRSRSRRRCELARSCRNGGNRG